MTDRSSKRPDLDLYIAGRELESDRAIAAYVVQHLIKIFDLEIEIDEDSPMMPADFNRISGLPYAVGACHIYGGASLLGLLVEPRKQELWQYFLDLKDAYGDRRAALVFNTNGRGRWVMHDDITLTIVRGAAIVHRERTDPFLAQSFTDFCAFLRSMADGE